LLGEEVFFDQACSVHASASQKLQWTSAPDGLCSAVMFCLFTCALEPASHGLCLSAPAAKSIIIEQMNYLCTQSSHSINHPSHPIILPARHIALEQLPGKGNKKKTAPGNTWVFPENSLAAAGME
jgi:hypothetical protein